MVYWFFLMSAIIFEVAGTISMKLSAGFTKLMPSVLIFVFYTASFAMLTLTLKKFEVGMVYAVWAGLGTALIATIGILYFRETVSFVKIISIMLIITGVVGLNLSGAKH